MKSPENMGSFDAALEEAKAKTHEEPKINKAYMRRLENFFAGIGEAERVKNALNQLVEMYQSNPGLKPWVDKQLQWAAGLRNFAKSEEGDNKIENAARSWVERINNVYDYWKPGSEAIDVENEKKKRIKAVEMINTALQEAELMSDEDVDKKETKIRELIKKEDYFVCSGVNGLGYRNNPETLQSNLDTLINTLKV